MPELNSDDLSQAYSEKAAGSTRNNDSQEMEEWAKHFTAMDQAQTKPFVEPVSTEPKQDKGRELPPPKPPRQETDDPMGRLPGSEESTARKVVRNVAEIPRQIAGGVDDAARNALGFLDPIANWLNDHVADLSYDPVSDPKTGTGAVTRKISEFLTGFIPATKMLKAVGVSNMAVQGVLGGAIADFTVRSPQEGRLADLWNEWDLPKNILTDYLKSNPEDSAVEGRFKNALEGVGLGTMFEGIMLGARTIRAARAVPGVKQAEEDFLRAKYGEVSESDIKATIGDPKRPAVSINAKLAAAEAELPPLEAKSVIRGRKGDVLPEDFQVYVNFGRMDEPNQVKFVIGKLAEAMKGHIDEARRGVVTQQETSKLADELGMTTADLLSRRKGVGFNAEEAVAARRLWAQSGEILLEAAKRAAAPNAGALDQFAFRRLMSIHSAIQAEVIGGRTETARALAAWKIPVGGAMERARAIEQTMNAMGGAEASKGMAQRLAFLAEEGANPAAIARFAERGAAATTMDAVKEAWVNGLLSSPKTHAVNIMSNTLVAFSSIYERAAAGGIRQMVGGEGVQMGEAASMAFGMVEGLKDAFRLSAKALKTGETHFSFGKVDLPRVNAISPEAFNISRETGLGRAVDFLGTATNVPARLLGAEDEFFKTIGYRMELRAQALRTAKQEGHNGEDLAKRIQEIVDNPPEHIRINSADAALYQTFTSEVGSFGRAIMNLRNIDSPANPLMFILPFVRTPINIARYAFERTPFAPLVSQWRADVAAGGARADLALAKMSTGTAIMAVAMDYADSGLISGEGPRDKDQSKREDLLRQGWQPYSVKLGDRWYSYNRADPFGMTVGFAASIAEAVRKGEIDQDDVDEWQEVAAMSIAAVSQVTISKTYLEGFAKFVEVMSDPKRYSQRYIDDLVASFIPATSLSNQVKNMVDPVQREVNTPADAVMAKIAGLSDKLPPRRDLWGQKITSESGVGKIYDFMSPVGAGKEMSKVQQPIDKEIMRLDAGPERINKRTNFDGVMANMRFYPQAYDDYTRLAGNDLKHPAWGMGARDYLNSVVTGKNPMSQLYNTLSDESRKDFIQSTISEYRKLAQQEVLKNPKHANFAREVSILKQQHQQAVMPVLGGVQQ